MKQLTKQAKNDVGFTLVEIIMAMFILSLIASSALLAFVFSIKTSKDNQYQMTAMNLANDRIEYIRSIQFADIGTKSVEGSKTVYGDPKGEILQSEIITVAGVNYKIDTTINWEDESGWETSTTDWDYKSIRIEVAPQIPGRESELTKVINTLVTRDSAQPILSGSNIALRAIRGWKSTPSQVQPIANVKVSMTGPSGPRQVKTSSNGVARFISLQSGGYTVNLDCSTTGMMLRPDISASWSFTLASSATVTKQIEVEYPCYLRIQLKILGGNTIMLSDTETGNIEIATPFGSPINKNFSKANITTEGYLAQDLIGPLWPVGSGYSGAYTVTNVKLNGRTYQGAYETISGIESPWSGTFEKPGTVKTITCYFK